ncbi:unnamed protein product [Cyprideis torosa]|uniref:Pyrroline-5-carboxylate reductase n=1 Tax=Cyprideis torosa TaxID=163714 RepID=A0A7R8WPP8_9CRUS|nr:unnamed protein product [Cyprideis torosa]CAG0902054.1 unnamed protein product [Cyprideis torosa]
MATKTATSVARAAPAAIPAVKSIGFIGAGKMAQALAKGFLSAGCVRAENIWASAPSEKNFEFWHQHGCQAVHENRTIPENCDITVLACKPPQIPSVATQIASTELRTRLLMTVAAGVPLKTITDIIKHVPVARIMTNTATQVCRGASSFCLTRGFTSDAENLRIIKSLLGSISFCEEVNESQLDAICAISGSGIAYMFLFLEAMADAGVKVGLSRELSIDLSLHTMAGAAALAGEDRAEHKAGKAFSKGFSKLREDVCSPGGTTIHGLHKLERHGFRSVVMDAIEAATERSKELGKK